MSGKDEWGDEWARWATTGGDARKARQDITAAILGRTPTDGASEATARKTVSITLPARRIAAAGAAAALCVTVFAAGAGIRDMSQKHSERMECEAAAQAYRTSLTRMTKAAASQKRLSSEDGDDQKMLDKTRLDAAAKPAKSGVRCPAGGQAAQSLRKAAAENDAAARRIENDLDAITKSRTTRQAAADRQALTVKITAANDLLNTAQGHVADDASINGLRQASDKAAGLLTRKDPTPKDIQGAAKALDDAMSAVNASVQAKANADAAAAQAAAQADQAQQPAPAPAPAPAPVPQPAPPRFGQGTAPTQPAPDRWQGGGWYVPPADDGNGGLPNHL
jgi:hypothetical protein